MNTNRWSTCHRVLDCWLRGLNSLHYFCMPHLESIYRAERQRRGKVAVNFICERSAARGRAHLFVYFLLSACSPPLLGPYTGYWHQPESNSLNRGFFPVRYNCKCAHPFSPTGLKLCMFDCSVTKDSLEVKQAVCREALLKHQSVQRDSCDFFVTSFV